MCCCILIWGFCIFSSEITFAQQPDSSAVQDSLLAALQKEMASFAEPDGQAQSGRTAARLVPTRNPDISVIGDIRAGYRSDGERNVDLGVEEIELALKSVIDPYARADVYLSMASEDGEIKFELEEAFITTMSLPHTLQLKAGKFRNTVGKINLIHPHALPFLNMPAVYTNFLGDEGLNDQGVSLSWLVPNGSFYQELTFEITRGPDESPSFSTDDGNRLLYTGHLKNFWDLSENSTFELGLTGINGPNDLGLTSTLAGFDITYKWKPVRYNRYKSFTLQAETFFSFRSTDSGRINSMGLYALASYQLAERWMLLARYDHSDLPDDPDWNENGVSSTLGWLLTEFQKVEFGVRRSWGDKIKASYAGVVRVVFVIGTHGAHQY